VELIAKNFINLGLSYFYMKKVSNRLYPVTTLVLLMVSVVLVAMTSTTQASSIVNLTKEERLQRANDQLKKIEKNMGGQSVALVSFREFKKKEFAKELAEQHGLKASQIYAAHATTRKTFRGGYFVGEDGMITNDDLSRFEEQAKASSQFAVERYNRMIEESLKYFENFQEVVTKGPDGAIVRTEDIKEQKKLLEGTRQSLKDEEAFLGALNNSGLKVYGLLVTASNDRLLKLSNHPDVHVVEVLSKPEDDKKASPILPTN